MEQPSLERTTKDILVQPIVGKKDLMKLSSTLQLHLKNVQGVAINHIPGDYVSLIDGCHCKKFLSDIKMKFSPV